MDDLIERLVERISGEDPRTDLGDREVFPPASPETVQAAEEHLGFVLPPLLREIYLNVCNGGLGPGYGLIGLRGGATAYGFEEQGDGMAELTLDELYQDLRLTEFTPEFTWPEKMLPLSEWGTWYFSCLDCASADYDMVFFDPVGNQFRPHNMDLAEWLDAWLDGVNLWEQIMGPAGGEYGAPLSDLRPAG